MAGRSADTGGRKVPELIEKDRDHFYSKFERPERGCWLWPGPFFKGGYGMFTLKRIPRLAHRISYEIHVGPIRPGYHIDHLCSVRNCVNPSHLEQVTHAENMRRGMTGTTMKTHCLRGHPLDGPAAKVSIIKTPKGFARRCLYCRSIRGN